MGVQAYYSIRRLLSWRRTIRLYNAGDKIKDLIVDHTKDIMCIFAKHTLIIFEEKHLMVVVIIIRNFVCTIVVLTWHLQTLQIILKGWKIHNQFTQQLQRKYIFCQVEATYPHPSSQLADRLGLCSQSIRCDCSWSSRSVAVQPKPASSQLIWSFDSM